MDRVTQVNRLRRIVGAIGLSVAVTTAILIPAGYFFVGYSNIAETAAFKARLNASRVSQYIYTHTELWQYQHLRLSELIQLPEAGERPTRQQIFDIAGTMVVNDGIPLPAPTVSRAAPIVVSGATVGSLVVEAGLSDLLRNLWFVSGLSLMLGFVMYFAVRMFPLRVLDRTLGMLRATQADLAEQNRHFDAALTNMSQGLCMFGVDGRLAVFNPRFAEIYKLAPGDIRTGMTARELIALALASGAAKDDDAESALALTRNFLAAVKPGTATQRLSDGRSIAVSYRPMPDGGFVATFEDITERLEAEAKIKHLAHHDALTDLPNRVAFYEQIDAILAHLRRNEGIAVLSLDLDHFKSVNDTLGHPIGDRLLQGVAGRIRSCIRDEDVVARLGGDEFAIVQVPSEGLSNITSLAVRLIEAVSMPFSIDGHQVVVGASIGIAVAPSDSDVPDTLMKNADLALYRAKADGGGVYRFFEIEMDTRMQARRALELDLRKAIINGEFELYYQPITNVKTRQITSFEALVRWHHPDRGMIPPLEFIPIAEETGLIVPLGEWIIRQACADAVLWPGDITVAVNLSPAQFKSRNLVPSVFNALAASGLPASRLELEITEMVLVQESDGAFETLHRFRDIGIGIAMDDFGTGYSSLGYLRSFPFNKIKIDKSFIRDLPTKKDNMAIVRAVVGLSSSLGIITTAEGVETVEELASVAAEGCNEVQGYLFSTPRPAAEVARILRDQAPRVTAAS